jgi:GNAT superfamily N-acetyltransferase
MTDEFFPGVSFARPEDEDEIFAMLLELHKENGLFLVDEIKVRKVIRSATRLGEPNDRGFIGLIRGERIEGSVGLLLDQWWYTSEWCLQELWCFVHPDFRRQNHARRLVDFAKWCSDKMEMRLVMGIMSTQRTEAKERLYRRKLTPVGGLFAHSNGGPVVTGAPDVRQ